MRFLRAALTMAKTAVYSLHKTSTREVSSVSVPAACSVALNSRFTASFWIKFKSGYKYS